MKMFDSSDWHSRMENRSFVSLVLGIMTLISAAAYLLYRYVSERAYREKWKDYDDCGIMEPRKNVKNSRCFPDGERRLFGFMKMTGFTGSG